MRYLHGAVIAAVLACASPAIGATRSPIHLEAEKGALTGLSILHDTPGFTGTGYVGIFDQPTSKLTFTIPNAAAGIYRVVVRYNAPGEKGFDLVVNDGKYSGMFPASGNGFARHDAGRVELKHGVNTVGIEKGWGWYSIDSLDLIPNTATSKTRKPSVTPADPKASTEARSVLKYLVRQYGSKTLSGQYDPGDNAYVREKTGQLPAIQGGDFMEYSPSRREHGSNPDNESEKMIKVAQSGQLVTMTWHWNAPSGLIDKDLTDAQGNKVDARWYRGFYTSATTFDLAAALAAPNSPEYKLLLRDMDVIAAELQKFQEAGVPVLWRPLHEADGGWFWWGAKGPKAFKALWRLMYDRFTNVHHLHNLIWVSCSGIKPEWYPGDKYVDIVGIDAYPSDTADPLSSTWDILVKQYGGRKMLAVTEFGGVPDVEKMHRFGTAWSYFVSWSGDLGAKKMPDGLLKTLYTAKDIVNKDGLPHGITSRR